MYFTSDLNSWNIECSTPSFHVKFTVMSILLVSAMAVETLVVFVEVTIATLEIVRVFVGLVNGWVYKVAGGHCKYHLLSVM